MLNAVKKYIRKRYSDVIVSLYDDLFKSEPLISKPVNVEHNAWVDYLSQNFNLADKAILEIGSRNVTGSNFRGKFDKAEYIGFDFYEGENVDIAGDIHRLTDFFPADKKFDLIFSSAVFEHLHMPWVAAEQIQKMLKLGGYVFVETHFSFSAHERPWNFFQYSDMGLRALFNEALGFEFIDGGMSNPMIGHFSHGSMDYLKHKPIAELYCHSEILCRKRADVTDFQWKNLQMDDVVGGTRYPPPRGIA